MIVLGAQSLQGTVYRGPDDAGRMRTDAPAQRRAGPAQRGVAGGGQIRVGGDEQLLLSPGARIVDERGERGVLLFGDTRGSVLALAIRPVLPLLLEAMEGGRLVLAQQRDVQGFGQGEKFEVPGGFGFGFRASGSPRARPCATAGA